MDGREKKEEPSLPPDYVSLAQLQERWLQKQQEKKMKETVEEEKKEGYVGQNQRGSKNDGHEKMGGGSVRGGLRRRVKKDGGEIGAVEDKGKGEEIVFENGEENQKKGMEKRRWRRKKKKGQLRKMKSAEDGEKGNQEEKGNQVENGNQEEKGNQVENGTEIEELDGGDGVKGENPDEKKMGFRGGFGRNGHNRGRHNKSKEVYRVKLNELKQSEVTLALDGKKLRERGRNGGYRERSNRSKEGKPDVLKGNEVEPELDKKAEDESLGVSMCGLSGGDRNGVCSQSNMGRDKAKEHRVEGDLNDTEVVVVESAENGEKGGVGKEHRVYGNRKGNKACNVRSRVEVNVVEGRRYTRSRKIGGRWNTKQRESGMMWVKKEKLVADAAEVGSSGNHLFYYPA